MDLSTIEQEITSAIGQQETSSGTAGVGTSDNNPGAIKYASWESAYGATQGANGFAVFPSLAAGWNAALNLVNQYVQSGASISSLISSWAPASDGNTNNAQRTASIAQQTGLNASQGILSQLGGAVGSAASSAVSGSLSSIVAASGLSWVRVAAFLVGFACIVAALLLSRAGQEIVVQPVVGAGKTAAKTAVRGALF